MLAACAALTLGCAVLFADIPPPEATPAAIIVSGHTSTAVAITVVKVGQEIPVTYAGTKIHNMPGFDFYVSEHYALQTNMSDSYAKSLLEVAELAYPHWVDLVGAEPPDQEKRMYMVYASTSDLMCKAITNDTGLAAPSQYGGGITIDANRSAYNYPSGTLLYHQRALAIHENLHMLQMIVYGTGGLEDFTYSAEQSVYDPVKKQLTVMVFDKATTNNWTDIGLDKMQAEKPPFSDLVTAAWSAGGGLAVVFTQFMWTDPDRYLKWQIWRDEYYLGHINAKTVLPVTENIFGPLDIVDTAWQTWLQTRHNSFHYVDWGWEQDGNTLWSYGYPQHTPYSETDIRYKPSDPAVYDQYRMDYPGQPMSDLVGPIKRGIETPSVGAAIDFSRNKNNGVAGLGLGVVNSTYYAVMLRSEDTLSVFSQGIDSADLTLPRQDLPLPEDLVNAAHSDGDRLGVTITIKTDALQVTVRAGTRPNIKTASFYASINAAQRDRIMNNYMAVLAKSGRHGITPYIDDARHAPPDLTVPAAPNFWRFEGMNQLETLYKAVWELGMFTPKSLLNLKTEMLAAVDADSKARSKTMRDYDRGIAGVFHDIQRCGATQDSKGRAEVDLAGIFVITKTDNLSTEADPDTTTTIINRLPDPERCDVTFDPSNKALSARIKLEQYQPLVLRRPSKPGEPLLPLNLKFEWRGQSF